VRVTFYPLEDWATGMVELTPGVVMPRRTAARVTGSELPYDLRVTITLEDGRFVCEALTCERKAGGPPIASERVRQIPVARVVEFVARYCLHLNEGTLDEPVILPDPWEWEKVVQAVEEARQAVGPGRQPQGPTDDVLRSVALIYRFAYACGRAPTKAVMDELELPRSTTGRWISLARERGYLGTTEERKAGVG
jgi:hypothetical protein